MSSIALSTTGTTASASTETDLARKAARGDRAAFDELFARHGDAGWRLAQAVAADRDGAVDSFKDGFVRAVKGRRASRRIGAAAPRRGAQGTLRDDILSAVYGAASASSYDASATPAAGLHRPVGGQDAALADAAFRSLPERWRAAVWLSEVEGFPTERTAGVMGVSTAVATQLETRGAKGLAGRFVQSHREPPAEFGPVLRALAIPVPTDLAATTLAGWATAAGPARRPIFAPAAAWLQNSGFRPLLVAVGGLLAFGLIGMGVIPENTTVHGQQTATGNGPVSGAVPVTTCTGLVCVTGATPDTASPAAAAFGATSPTLAGAFTPGTGATGIGFAGGGAGSALGTTTAGTGAAGSGSTRSASASGGSSSASSTGGGSAPSGSSSGGGTSKSGSTSSSTPTSTTQPPSPTNNITSAVTTLTNTATSTLSGAGSTVKQLPTNPAGALSSLGNTVTGTASGAGSAVNQLVGGTTTTTTAPKATTTTTPTTACALNLLGLCVG